ncbi:MAG: GrpB family protein [Candidatus Nanopelagicales bacterium]
MTGIPDTMPSSPDEEIRLVPYDSSWPVRYADEAGRLMAVLHEYATGGIHHVGSTAVPGLMAKPVIDILVGVESLTASQTCVALVAQLDYCYAPYRTDEMHWFCKPRPSQRTHHLHLVPTASQRFADELTFRDYLRGHADRARAYEQLKITLSERSSHDREAYTEGKAGFIRDTLELAAARD